MAAEVTLVAIPDRVWHIPTVGGNGGIVVTTRELIDIKTFTVTLPGDDITYDDDGSILAYAYTDERYELSRWEDDQEFDWQQVGSWSPLKAGLGLDRTIPLPTAAVYFYLRPGRIITPGLRAKTMALLSMPEGGTIYSRGHSLDSRFRLRHRRSRKYTDPRWPRYPDLARRPVRKFMDRHMGEYVVAESW